MNYIAALKYQKFALRFGLIFVGIILILGAINQQRTGITYGKEGKREGGYHVVRRDEMPKYFWFLFSARLILGIISLLLGLFLKW